MPTETTQFAKNVLRAATPPAPDDAAERGTIWICRTGKFINEDGATSWREMTPQEVLNLAKKLIV